MGELMNRIKLILGAVLLPLILLTCKPMEGTPIHKNRPALRIVEQDIFASRGTFLIEMVNADKAYILCKEKEETDPSAEFIIENGVSSAAGEYVQNGLESGKHYTIFGVATDDKGQESNICKLDFSTIAGAEVLYDWEKSRTEKPYYSNLALCYGGSSHRTPYLWDEDRFSAHVTYTDDKGVEKWLFDAFLAIEFVDAARSKSYMLGHGNPSADKASWTALMDYWFDSSNGFSALDKAVGKASERIGKPQTKRKVVMTLPDPIIYQNFKDTQSSTTYWGFLDGKQMDFSKAADRRQALRWYIDEVRRRWNNSSFENLEFIGFYIISEDLATPGYGWNPELKRWEDIYPEISDYIHSCNETLSWIPYNSSGGHQNWKKFHIDYAMMQPNYFWHSEYNMDTYMSMVKNNDLSMEFELDSKILESSDGSDTYRERFYKYMSMCKEMGLYGKRELSYYFGTNDFYTLSKSSYPKDKDLYRNLCNFIIESIH